MGERGCRRSRYWRRRSGFTLIELMITVVVLGILIVVGYPSYQAHLGKARRAEAKAALTGLAQAMERHFTENNAYTQAAVGPADNGTPAIYYQQVPVDGGTPYYTLNILTASATAYSLQANPTGVQAGDPCGTFTLDQTGVRGDATGGSCWDR